MQTSLSCDTNENVSLYMDVTWVQVPGGPHKKELLENLDRVPTYVQQLQFTVKNPTVGKAATFTKVDNVIQETKNLMNVISKVVTTCFVCATKVSHETIRYAPSIYFLNKQIRAFARFFLWLRLPLLDELYGSSIFLLTMPTVFLIKHQQVQQILYLQIALAFWGHLYIKR